MNGVYNLVRPSLFIAPLVLDSPHSGRIYPNDFNHTCYFNTLRTAEDHYVDELCADAPQYGATLLTAKFPRSYIDVNRAIDDIDPLLLSEEWPYGDISPSIRSNVGIGLIRRLIGGNIAVYDAPLPATDIKNRIESYYIPYHDALKKVIDDLHESYGRVYHLNMHAMPNHTAKPKFSKNNAPRDIVLSNRDGATCNSDFLYALRNICISAGLSVSCNDPFKGVECVRRYGRPDHNRHSVQVEINKQLYMSEDTQEKHSGFEDVKMFVSMLVKQAICFIS